MGATANNLFIFGGSSSNTKLNDLYRYNIGMFQLLSLSRFEDHASFNEANLLIRVSRRGRTLVSDADF